MADDARSRITDPASASELHAADHGSGSPHAALKVAVHDRSRLEWVATVPLAPVGQSHTWEIVLDAHIPDAMWVAHSPWEHFQVRSRLTSPVLAPGRHQYGPPIDQLRRRALAAVHELKSATVRLTRPLRSLRHHGAPLDGAEAQRMATELRAVAAEAVAAREAFTLLRNPHDDALDRELGLANEYVSNQLLMLLTQITAALGKARHKRRLIAALQGDTAPIRDAVQELLNRETAYRKAQHMRWAVLSDPNEIEGFVHRAALLKKHFQQSLFLDARAYMVDSRLRNWVAAAMAMVASSFYFFWQVWILNSQASAATTTASLIGAGAIAAVIYAAKDRIKELGREWLSRRVKDRYADRVAHLSLQQRMDPKCSAFALARETIHMRRHGQDDPLNPALGKTQVVHHLQVREKLRHTGLQILHDQGLLGLKHVFRYDVSPLMVKLDDQVKRVLVARDGVVRPRSGTRVYLVPVTVKMRLLGTSVELVQRGMLRMRRSGLERFVPAQDHGRRKAAVTPAPLPQAQAGDTVLVVAEAPLAQIA